MKKISLKYRELDHSPAYISNFNIIESLLKSLKLRQIPLFLVQGGLQKRYFHLFRCLSIYTKTIQCNQNNTPTILEYKNNYRIRKQYSNSKTIPESVSNESPNPKAIPESENNPCKLCLGRK